MCAGAVAEKLTKNDDFRHFLPLIARHRGQLLSPLWADLADILGDEWVNT